MMMSADPSPRMFTPPATEAPSREPWVELTKVTKLSCGYALRPAELSRLMVVPLYALKFP